LRRHAQASNIRRQAATARQHKYQNIVAGSSHHIEQSKAWHGIVVGRA